MSDGPEGFIFLLVGTAFLSAGSCVGGRDSMRNDMEAACADHCFPLAVHPEMDLVCQCAPVEGGFNE